jgi:branched-chain amino acid aminotransferase
MTYSQKGKYINYNGDNIRTENFNINIHNRAFKYGDGLFETIRAINKVPLFYREHITRLFYGMKLMKLDFASEILKNQLEKSIINLLDANKHFVGARLRITIYRNGEGLYTPENNNYCFVIESSELENNKFQLNKIGIKIGLYKNVRLRYSEFSQFKTLNSLPYILAGIYKKENNFDDCLLLNSMNNIVEGISSNLFLVKDNTLITSGLQEGGINGITRNIIIDIALSNKFILIEDANIIEKDLLNADEIFLTNSISGIIWVGAYKNKRYYNKISKKFIKELNFIIS